MLQITNGESERVDLSSSVEAKSYIQGSISGEAKSLREHLFKLIKTDRTKLSDVQARVLDMLANNICVEQTIEYTGKDPYRDRNFINRHQVYEITDFNDQQVSCRVLKIPQSDAETLKDYQAQLSFCNTYAADKKISGSWGSFNLQNIFTETVAGFNNMSMLGSVIRVVDEALVVNGQQSETIQRLEKENRDLKARIAQLESQIAEAQMKDVTYVNVNGGDPLAIEGSGQRALPMPANAGLLMSSQSALPAPRQQEMRSDELSERLQGLKETLGENRFNILKFLTAVIKKEGAQADNREAAKKVQQAFITAILENESQTNVTILNSCGHKAFVTKMWQNSGLETTPDKLDIEDEADHQKQTIMRLFSFFDLLNRNQGDAVLASKIPLFYDDAIFEIVKAKAKPILAEMEKQQTGFTLDSF